MKKRTVYDDLLRYLLTTANYRQLPLSAKAIRYADIPEPLFRPIKRKQLTDMTYSTGDMLTGKGERVAYFGEEQKPLLKYYASIPFPGIYCATYDGYIVYVGYMDINQRTADSIVHAIVCGYVPQVPELLTDSAQIHELVAAIAPNVY